MTRVFNCIRCNAIVQGTLFTFLVAADGFIQFVSSVALSGKFDTWEDVLDRIGGVSHIVQVQQVAQHRLQSPQRKQYALQ
jgi:hypothetical protein